MSAKETVGRSRTALRNSWVALLLAVVLLGIVASIDHSRNNGDQTRIRSVTMAASWAKGYSTVTSLKADADLVADGTITRVVSVVKNPNGLVFTDYALTISRVVYDKGRSATPSQVLIHQTGGLTGGVRFEMTDDPLLQVGEHVIVFLREYSPGRYYILGGPTGRFEVVQGYVHAITTTGVQLPAKLTESAFLEGSR